MRKHKTATLAAGLLLALVQGRAAVLDSAGNGFTVQTVVAIQAAPAAVYQQLVHIGDWWDSVHTFSGDAHNLSIEERASGCFCEKLPNGGGVRHLEVVNFDPGKKLTMTGGLGPLQSLAVTGSMTIALSPVNGGTKLEVKYAVTGYLAGGIDKWAAPVDGVLAQQFARLKNQVERHSPAPAAPKPDTQK